MIHSFVPRARLRAPLTRYAGLACAVAMASPLQAAGIDEVVVTATRRETAVQHTPMSISVLGEQTLATTRADDFADFAKLVPGLTAIDSGPGNKRYALRGLQSPGEPEVALYYDEIPVSGIPGGSLDTGDSQPDLKLWDIDRIEVLRGPQGTLYGNGSIGGAIRVISKRPELNKFSGETQVSAAATEGGDPSYRVNQMLNLPLLDDKLALRLAAYYRREGGWIDNKPRDDIAIPQLDQNDINDEKTWGGRAALSLQVSDAWNVTGIAYYQRLHTANAFDVYPDYATGGDRYISASYVHTPWLDKIQMYNLISTYDYRWGSFVATTSYQRRTVERNSDTTRYLLNQFHCNETNWNQTCFGRPLVPAVSYAHEEVEAWSGELRLVSNADGPLQWTVGGEFQNSDTYRNGEVAKTDADGYIQFDGNGDAVGRMFARKNDDSFDQYSFFGDTSYEIVRDVRARIGLRWFHSDRSDQQTIVQQFAPGQPTGDQPYQRFEQDLLAKSFQVSWQATPDALFYIQAAEGFRAGGPNFPGGFTVSAPPYDADSVWDYELGWKLSFLDNRVNWNGAIFHIDWDNLQVLVPTQLFSYITNANGAKSDGFETEIDAALDEHWNITAGATYNDARLVGTQPQSSNPAAQLHDGDELANVPKWTANAGVMYRQPIAAQYQATARVDFVYQSSRGSMVADQNPAYFRAAGYELVDAHFNLDRNDGWGLSLDIENLFNRYAELSTRVLDSNLAQTVSTARPRTFSVGVSKKY